MKRVWSVYSRLIPNHTQSLHKKWCFPLRISSVNVNKKSFLRIWSHLLKKYLIENFIFCVHFWLLSLEYRSWKLDNFELKWKLHSIEVARVAAYQTDHWWSKNVTETAPFHINHVTTELRIIYQYMYMSGVDIIASKHRSMDCYLDDVKFNIIEYQSSVIKHILDRFFHSMFKVNI